MIVVCTLTVVVFTFKELVVELKLCIYLSQHVQTVHVNMEARVMRQLVTVTALKTTLEQLVT